MRLVTMASLGASAVLGVAALIVAKTALPEATEADGKPVLAAEANLRPMVVAAKPIAFGARLEASQLTIAKVPANAVPEGAFTTIEAALSQDEGGAPVAITTIAQREALLPAKLSGPGARPTIAAEITEGMRAYTVKVNEISGVGGHALPGDRVDVVLMRNIAPSGENSSTAPNLVSQVVLQNVRVLGVDLNADPTSATPAAPSNATLEVTMEDAQKLSMATNLGELSLALRRTGAADTAPTALVRTGDFIGAGQRPVAVRSTWRAARPATPYAPRPRVIRVVEGEGAGSGA
jgi:pilus assembly protein CpaB